MADFLSRARNGHESGTACHTRRMMGLCQKDTGANLLDSDQSLMDITSKITMGLKPSNMYNKFIMTLKEETLNHL